MREIRFVESEVRVRENIVEQITVLVSWKKKANLTEGVVEPRQRNTYPVSFTLWLQLIWNRLSFERISIDRLRWKVRERGWFCCTSASVRPRGWVLGLRETCSLSPRQLHSAFLRSLVSTRLYQSSPFVMLLLPCFIFSTTIINIFNVCWMCILVFNFKFSLFFLFWFSGCKTDHFLYRFKAETKTRVLL